MATIREDVLERGFAFRPSYGEGVVGEISVAQVGTPVSLGSGSSLHALTPASTDQRGPNSYSGLYGLGAFPLHTDLAHYRLPPRYFVLRCRLPGSLVGTTLLDSADIVASVGASLLSRGLVQPRRPRAGTRPLLRLYDPAIRLFRWDFEFIRPASDAGAEAVAAVGAALHRSEPAEIRLDYPGDMVVIDNWRMLHGRTAVPPSGTGRCIERVYLEGLY
jgi:alpha-ketoglutarate-dependent taurine dioxygenase